MGTRKFTVSITTASDGTATGYSPWFSGKIDRIEYVKDGGANPYANGVDFTMTLDVTGETVWAELNVNASTSRVPRADRHTALGAAALYAAAGTAVGERIAVGGDRVKIVLAQGGASKVGSFNIVVSDR